MRARWSRTRNVVDSRSPTSAAVLVLAAGTVGLLALMPIAFLLWQTFVVQGVGLSLDNVRAAYQGRFGLGTLTWNTLWFTLGSTVVALPIGTGLAWLTVRTNVPLRRLVFVAAVVPMIIPGILHTIAWVFLASPRIGLLNHLVEPVVGPGFLNVFSLSGMSLVEGLHTAPLIFLLMAAAFRSIDPALEESALLSGAGRIQVFARVTLPLAKPGLAASLVVLVVNGLSSFEVPALLGIPSGIWVFTSRIWRVLSVAPVQYGQAGAYALSLLVLTSIGVWWQARLGSKRDFETVTGKGFRTGSMDLGPWRWPATIVVATYFLVTVVLPLLVMLYMSTQPFYLPPSWETIRSANLDNYRQVLGLPTVARALRNSMVLGVGSATAVMMLSAVVAWIVVRSRVPGRWLLDNLATLPLAIPGLVIGVSVLFVGLRSPLPVYGTLWIMLIAYMIKYLPYGMRYASTSMAQVGSELEESAAVSGATWWQQFRRITLPLVMPGVLSGWLYIFMVSMRELSSSLLLFSPRNEVLAVVIFEQWRSGQTGTVAAFGVLIIIGLVVIVSIASRIGARIGLGA